MYLFGGPHIEEYSILGSMLGYPNFGKVPYGSLLGTSLPHGGRAGEVTQG